MNEFIVLKKKHFEEFQSDRNIVKLIRGLTQSAQSTLKEAWHIAELDSVPGQQAPCLVAVGGFGRGDLFPYSDIDILVLLNHEVDASNPELCSKLEKFISCCWDFGLEIGSSVRTLEECRTESAKDITVRTALLESKFLEGNKSIYQRFQKNFELDMDPKAFFVEKLLELRQRHQKYQNTPYALEPNLKESPGGLRDIQVILWMTKAAGLGNSINDLAHRGIITSREARELRKNQKTLELLRAQLHINCARRQDALIFEVQTPLAQSFGYETTSAKRASEQIMRKYYWAAKAVTQLNEILIQNIEAILFPKESFATRPLSDNFVERQGQLDIIDPLLFEKQPDQIFEAFILFAQDGTLSGFSSQVLRAIYNSRDVMNAQWRVNPIHRQLFMKIIKEPKGVFRTLNLMNQTSVLGRYLPPFRKIVGQMQHDLFHVYTVDQHIMTVLKNVRRFFVPELAHEFPFCSELAANFDKPWILTLGAIFHDIAKGRGGDHSVLGKKDIQLFANQHGLSKDEHELVSFLVAEHLSMSQIAQKMDISDPETIEMFANKVKDERHLTALYLLTVADIRGTSPKVWNSWKGKLLEDLYRLTLRYLGGARFDTRSQLEQKQQNALDLLRLHGLPENSHQELWNTINVGFFLKQDANDIAWLTRNIYQSVHTEVPIVKARISPIGEGLQIGVYVKDQDDLFARICAYFDQKSLTILDATVHTTKHGYALDSFQVSYLQGQEMTEYRPLIQMVEYELSRIIAEEKPLPHALQGRISRQSRTFPIQPRVKLVPDERGDMFILSLTASDRVGLLYAVSKVLAQHRISLRTAKINTLGERVEDTLLVDGDKLKLNPKLQIQVETELIDALST